MQGSLVPIKFVSNSNTLLVNFWQELSKNQMFLYTFSEKQEGACLFF